MDKEKLRLAQDGMSAFFEQFGQDVYTKIVLEVFFEKLYDKNIPVLSPPRQEGSEDPDSP